jgi:hypothetical protein
VRKGKIINRPLAGTVRRGKTEKEDEMQEQQLLSDEKQCAEHIMLVDLGRNDVGKVSKPGSVKVEKLMNIERYSHVMHISSTVRLFFYTVKQWFCTHYIPWQCCVIIISFSIPVCIVSSDKCLFMLRKSRILTQYA